MTNIKPKEHKPKSIRDPIHGFVEITADEQKIVDSPQFQRLRDISQLSFTHLVYPGATHKRFEHSLGVMHVASEIFDRVFDKLIDADRFSAYQKEKYKEEFEQKDYWRQVLRLAALCHDIGHLPFSHTLEGLLQKEANKNHETLSHDIIQGKEGLKSIIESITVGESRKKINARDVSFIAMGRKNRKDSFAEDEYSDTKWDWMSSLGDIISSDLFGADRMDYLVRDAYHAGVPYGKVDIPQLYRSILKSIPNQVSITNLLDIDVDNIHEGDLAILTSFLMSRQLMYSQVYQHPVCKVYDVHLVDFVKHAKAIGEIESFEDLVKLADSDILSMLRRSQQSDDHLFKAYGQRLLNRQHFKLAARLDTKDIRKIYEKIHQDPEHDGDRLDQSYDGYIESICAHIDEKITAGLPVKKYFNPPKVRGSGEGSPSDGLNQELKGYSKIHDELKKGDFSFCYIYADPKKIAKVKKLLNKYIEVKAS